MKVIYRSIVDKVFEICEQAELNRRTIKRIELTDAEMDELKFELIENCYPGALSMEDLHIAGIKIVRMEEK